MHEALVGLQLVRHFGEVGQVGVASAEVVDGEADAKRGQGIHPANRQQEHDREEMSDANISRDRDANAHPQREALLLLLGRSRWFIVKGPRLQARSSQSAAWASEILLRLLLLELAALHVDFLHEPFEFRRKSRCAARPGHWRLQQ